MTFIVRAINTFEVTISMIPPRGRADKLKVQYTPVESSVEEAKPVKTIDHIKDAANYFLAEKSPLGPVL